jgi:tRNA A37 threonylcarbamoyladenosine biosynthesis protein TsaE
MTYRVPLLTNDAFAGKKRLFSLDANDSARTSFAKLDASKLDPHTVLFFIGKRNSGKTALVRDICYNMHVHKCKGTAVGLPVAF